MSTWREAQSLDTLDAQVTERFPGRDPGSEGSIGDAAHRAEVSDHNPDAQGVVRAHDFDADWTKDGDRRVGPWLAATLLAGEDARIKYVIWSGRIFYGSRAAAQYYQDANAVAWTWYPYVGIDMHTNHLHVSVVASAAADNPAEWNLGATDMPLTKADLAAIAKLIDARLDQTETLIYYGERDAHGNPKPGGGAHPNGLDPLGRALRAAVVK